MRSLDLLGAKTSVGGMGVTDLLANLMTGGLPMLWRMGHGQDPFADPASAAPAATTSDASPPPTSQDLAVLAAYKRAEERGATADQALAAAKKQLAAVKAEKRREYEPIKIEQPSWVIGAGEGLKNQYVVVRVNRLDEAVFKAKLAEAGQSAVIAPAVALTIDRAPKFLVDAAIPFVERKLREYGVDATVTAADVPPEKGGRKRSEFLPGAAAGAGAAVLAVGVGWGAWKLFLKRIFT